MKEKISEELGDELLHSSVDVGYFDGRQSVKVWLVSAKDLDVMYEKAKTSGEIFLWVQNCEDTDDESDSAEPCRKKGKYQSKEDKLDEIYCKLKSQHDGTVYTMPQLRL